MWKDCNPLLCDVLPDSSLQRTLWRELFTALTFLSTAYCAPVTLADHVNCILRPGDPNKS